MLQSASSWTTPTKADIRSRSDRVSRGNLGVTLLLCRPRGHEAGAAASAKRRAGAEAIGPIGPGPAICLLVLKAALMVAPRDAAMRY